MPADRKKYARQEDLLRCKQWQDDFEKEWKEFRENHWVHLVKQVERSSAIQYILLALLAMIMAKLLEMW